MTTIKSLALRYDDGSMNVCPPFATIDDARRQADWDDDSLRPEIVTVEITVLEVHGLAKREPG